jgi:YgiT-type zinc finger domain-containing protein
MKCFHCQAELKRGTATFSDSRKGYVIVLQDIPAWVCPQCGEPLFDADAVRGIQDVLKAVDERVEKLRLAA